MKKVFTALALSMALLFVCTPIMAQTEPPPDPSAADRVVDYAIEKLDATFDAIEQATPAITEAALMVTRIELASHLAGGVLGLIVLLICVTLCSRVWHRCWGPDPKAIDGVNIVAMITCVPAFLFSLSLLNVWNWVGLWYPELYLIRKAVEAATGV